MWNHEYKQYIEKNGKCYKVVFNFSYLAHSYIHVHLYLFNYLIFTSNYQYMLLFLGLGLVHIFEKNLLCWARLHLFDQKCNKNSKLVKYYYNLKNNSLSILIYLKILLNLKYLYVSS